MTPLSSAQKLAAKKALVDDYIASGLGEKYSTVKDLRKAFGECGESVLDAEVGLDSKGNEIPVHKAKKDQLIAQLNIWANLFNVETEVGGVKNNSEQLKGYAHKLFTLYKKVVLQNKEGADFASREDYQRFTQALDTALVKEGMVALFKSMKVTHGPRKGLPYEPNSVLGNRREILATFKHYIEVKESGYTQELLRANQDLITRFMLGISTESTIESKAKSAANFEATADRKVGVKLGSAIAWAEETLEAAEVSSWYDLSIALALVTGRRQIELHTYRGDTTEGIFKPSEKPGHVQFGNQRKLEGKQGKAKGEFEKNPWFDIPVLVDSELVLQAYATFLERFGADSDNAAKVFSGHYKETYKKVNTRINNYLSRAKNGRGHKITPLIKRFANDHIEAYLDGKLVDINSLEFGDKEGFTYHSLRTCYTLKAMSALSNESDKEAYISQILGHERGGKDIYHTIAQRYTRGTLFLMD